MRKFGFSRCKISCSQLWVFSALNSQCCVSVQSGPSPLLCALSVGQISISPASPFSSFSGVDPFYGPKEQTARTHMPSHLFTCTVSGWLSARESRNLNKTKFKKNLVAAKSPAVLSHVSVSFSTGPLAACPPISFSSYWLPGACISLSPHNTCGNNRNPLYLF